MKDQDQNLAVAKFHGWEEIKHNPKTGLWYGKPPKDAAHPWDVVVPDYGRDLNAIHKVEMHCLTNSRLEEEYYFRVDRNIFASASQRREALLRTLNLWTED
jgi:hypothetical protein